MLVILQKAIWFALFACVLIVFGAGVWYSSDKAPSKQQHQETGQAQNKTDALIKHPVGSASQINTAPKTQNTDAKKNTADEIILKWLVGIFDFRLTDALIAAFTFLLALKTSGLFRETAGLRDAADKQRIDMLRSVEASERAAEAAQKSANAAINANTTTRAQVAAYLAFTKEPKPTITINEDGAARIDFYIVNTGQSTAHNAYIRLQPLLEKFELPASSTGPFEIPIDKPLHIDAALQKIPPDFMVFFHGVNSTATVVVVVTVA